MKNILKLLALGAVTLGALVGCDDKKSSNVTPSSDVPSSQISSSDSSSSAIASSINSSSSVAPTLTGIVLNTTNVKKAYEQGEALDLTGLVVNAKYSDNSTAAVNNYTVNPTNGTVLNEIGDVNVTVTFSTFTESFKVAVSKPTKKAWTEEEAKTMSDNLYGVVLPFTGYETSVVFYDDQDEKVYVYGGAYSDSFLTNYHTKLVADGFVDYQEFTGTSITMEKAVNTNSGVKHVYVYAIFSSNQLYIEAYDPYYYAFPTAFAQKYAKNLFSSEVAMPAITADYYEADENYLRVTCYYQSNLEDGGYSEILRAANWTVQSEKDDEGFYIAISSDRSYQVAYKYLNGKLVIYMEALFFWNSELIERFYNKYNGTVVNIPALEVEGAQYQFVESVDNTAYFQNDASEFIHAFMYIYGTKENDVAVYASILEDAGWDIEEGNDIVYAFLTIENKGVARIEVEYYEQKQAVLITIYFMLDPIPSKVWPAEEIAELLGGYQQDILPEYTETNKGFTILNDMFGTAVMVHVAVGNEDYGIESYIDILTTNGYKTYGDDENENNFISENDEIIVNVCRGTRGSFTINFEAAPMTKFPSAYIQKLFKASKDTVPALNGASLYNCEIIAAGTTLAVHCIFDTAGDASAAFGEYITTLTNAEYKFGGESYGTKFYTSKNNEFTIGLQLFTESKSVVLNIEGEFVNTQSLWPADKLATLFQAKGFTDPLPAYEGACDAISADTDYSGNIFVLIETSNANSVYSDYCDLLGEEGFAYDYNASDYYVSVYKSPNKQYTVSVDTNRFGVSLTLKAIATQGGNSAFPMASLLVDIPEAEGVLPIIEDSNASFEYDYYFGEAFVKVTYSSKDAATAAFNAYVDTLTTAGFTSEKLWGYLPGYVSPDGKIAVDLDSSKLDDGEFTIGVLNDFQL